ncbi:homing endonuclease associated repeat-containing protein [Listeria booriae]|uniref:homing endonuclease associated repeat-containing protein n=1 Tax=Listeria booriae TaxID=1552123 RepID=UPI0016251447|nr:hypothetical protein [Listeria booriae]MBC1291746.1 hypothetical protein [Listeria booriae]
MAEEAIVTKEVIIAELQQLVATQGRVPRQSMYEHFKIACRLFGSWQEALRAAGLEKVQRRVYKEAFLIEEVQRIAEELGRPPISGPYEFPLYMSVMEYYDSWEAFLARAGLKKFAEAEEGQAIKDKLIDNVLEMEQIMRRFPTMSECQDFRLIRYYFGSWKNFKAACELRKAAK